MIYVYALVPGSPAGLPGTPGLGGAALKMATEGGVAGVYSDALLVPAATEEQLLGHEAVVESLMTQAAVLPVRFGTRLEDETALRQLLARHGARLTAGLDHVRGRAEMGVRVLWDEQGPDPTADAPPTDSGRAYLLARLAQDRDQQGWSAYASERAAALHEPLAQLAVDDRLRVLPRGGTLMAGAYLVAREDTTAITEAAERLASAHPELTVVPTGPWPPHSFAPALEEHR